MESHPRVDAGARDASTSEAKVAPEQQAKSLPQMILVVT